MLKAAFASGQSALKLYFDHDEPEKEVEDAYNARPLPYIIGTELFIDSADGGLAGGAGDEHYHAEEDGEGDGDFGGDGEGNDVYAAPTGAKRGGPDRADEGGGEWSGDDGSDNDTVGGGEGEGGAWSGRANTRLLSLTSACSRWACRRPSWPTNCPQMVWIRQ